MRLVWHAIKAPVEVLWRVRRARWMGIVAFAVILLIDFALLPNGRYASSDIKRFVANTSGLGVRHTGPSRPPHLLRMWGLEQDGGVSIGHSLGEYAGDFDQIINNAQGLMTCFAMRDRSGWWAATHETRGVYVDTVSWSAAPLTPGFRASLKAAALECLAGDARPVFEAHLGAERLAGYERAIAFGPWRETRIIWAGVAHSALAALGGLALVWLVGLEVCAEWVLARRRRRRKRGHCVFCGYDLGGAGEGAACPECGRDEGGGLARGG